jgi:2-amino-4-hydroxy-6-hydroxymethyldihydropteridine diphosphokinase
MGANLPSGTGPPEATLAAALERMATLGRIARISSLYSTEPVGYAKQPRFLNAAVALETDAAVRDLLSSLQSIERELGRDREHSIRNGPRTIDLDILLFGDCVIDGPGLRIPHPRLAERAFVLLPLSEIAPEAVEPSSGKSVHELLLQLPVAKTSGAPVAEKVAGAAWARMQSQLPATIRIVP